MRNDLIVGVVGVLIATGASYADLPDTSETSCEITPGGSFDSDLKPNNDVDWCQFATQAGYHYAFQLLQSGEEGENFTLVDGAVTVRDANGTLLSSRFPNGQPVLGINTFYQATEDGLAYVAVSTRGDGAVGTYRVVMGAVDDHRGDRATTSSLVAGGAAQGELDAWRDKDWFQFDVIEGFYYRIDVETQDKDDDLTAIFSAIDLMLIEDPLDSPTGTFQTYDIQEAPNIRYNARENKTIWLEVEHVGQLDETGTYRVRLSAPDEAAVTGPNNLSLAPGQSRVAALQARGDSDGFEARVGANEHYHILAEGVGIDDLNSSSLCIKVLDANSSNFITGERCRSGIEPLTNTLSFETTSATELITIIFPQDGELMSAGGNLVPATYRVSMSPRDDFPASANSDGHVEPGFFATGVIQARGDEDWFSVPLVSGNPAEVRVETAASGTGTLQSVSLEVFDPDGSFTERDLGLGGDASATFTPARSGDYQARVIGHCEGNPVTCELGSYRLSVSQGDQTDPATNVFAATLPQARAVQIGNTATFLASILNNGTETALSCGIASESVAEVGLSFSAVNAPDEVPGDPNRRVDIPAGQSQGFVIAVTPMNEFSGEAFEFSFDCANTDPAPVAAGVNGFSLSADRDPLADLIMIAASPSNDGVARIPGTNGTGFFTVAAVNIGSEETLTFSATASGEANVSPVLCETDPGTGACLAALAGSVERTVANGEVVFFSVFFAGGGETVPFDPAETRIRFNAEAEGALRGATSVAVATD